MTSAKLNPSSSIAALPCVLALCMSDMPGNGQDNSGSADVQKAPSASSEPPAGLLPVPDYSGDFWTRGYLSDDWGGVRTDLANKGVQFGLQWNQYVQGVADGGRDRGVEYGGISIIPLISI